MISNLVLDVGKVLVQWDPDEAMRKLDFSEEERSAISTAMFTSGKWAETDRGVLSDEELLTFFYEEAPVYKEQIKRLWDNIDLAIWQFPYVKDWIRSMKAAGYRVYILSNYGEHTYHKTRESGLNFLPMVDGAIFSYTIQMVKPNAEIYEALCERFDLKPEECIFIDDLPANIEGAKAVGMQGIVFTGISDVLAELKKLGVELEME